MQIHRSLLRAAALALGLGTAACGNSDPGYTPPADAGSDGAKDGGKATDGGGDAAVDLAGADQAASDATVDQSSPADLASADTAATD
jgi:hypothetical protein